MRGYFDTVRNNFRKRPAAAAGSPRGAGGADEGSPAGPDAGEGPALGRVLVVGAVAMAWVGMIGIGGIIAWVAMPADQSPEAIVDREPPRLVMPAAAGSPQIRDGNPVGYAPTPWVEIANIDADGRTDGATAAVHGRVPVEAPPVADEETAAASAAPIDPTANSDLRPPEPAAVEADRVAEEDAAPADRISGERPPESLAAVPPIRPQPVARPGRRETQESRRHAAARAGRDRIYVRSAYSPPRPFWGGSAMLRECDRPTAQFDVARSGHHGEFCR